MRRVFFQVHLWSGVILAAYVVVVGLTGSALVFRQELQRVTFARYFDVRRPAGAAYPGFELAGIDYPTARRGTYLSYLVKGSSLVSAFSDPTTGDVIGELPKTSWITRLQDLHFNLLAGSRGRAVNGR